jgi:hypothetical protein
MRRPESRKWQHWRDETDVRPENQIKTFKFSFFKLNLNFLNIFFKGYSHCC